MSATLDAATIRRLADMHAVYRLFDEEGTLLYVGMSGRAGRRFDDHAVKNWWPLVRTVTLEWHDTKAQAVLAERRAISSEYPRYNKSGTGPAKALAQKLAYEEKQRTLDERRRRVAEEKQRLAEEQMRVTEEEQRLAEERARLMRDLPPRDLLADLDPIVGSERIRLPALAHLLQQLAPDWEPYRMLNGVKLRDQLQRIGVRVRTTNGYLVLDPADFRKVCRDSAA